MISSTATTTCPPSKTPSNQSNLNHITTPTNSDYLSILQSFAFATDNSIASSSPLINISVLPSPIHFPGLPGIVGSISTTSNSINPTSIAKQEDISIHKSEESEQSLELQQAPIPTIPIVKAAATPSSTTSSVSKIPKLAEKNIQRLRAQTQNIKVESPFSTSKMTKHGEKNIQRLLENIQNEGPDSQPAHIRRSKRVTQKIAYGFVDDYEQDEVEIEHFNDDEIDVEHEVDDDEEHRSSSELNQHGEKPVKRSDAKPQDVLSGRGLASCKHPGNVLFRQLVYKYKPQYERKSSVSFRQALAKKIVDEIYPGRFVKFDGQSTGRVLDYEASTTKALFAMRDCKKCPALKRSNLDLSFITEEPLPKRRTTNVSMQNTKVMTTPALKKANKRPKQGRKSIKTVKKSTKSPKKIPNSSEQKRKTVTPLKEPRNALALSEIRCIKSLIEVSIDPNEKFQPSSLYPQTRCEEIHALIEEMVAKGAEIRRNASRQNLHEEWFHPQMQKCIRLQILQRCRIAMQTTGMNHTDFFDKLFHLELFP